MRSTSSQSILPGALAELTTSSFASVTSNQNGGTTTTTLSTSCQPSNTAKQTLPLGGGVVEEVYCVRLLARASACIARTTAAARRCQIDNGGRQIPAGVCLHLLPKARQGPNRDGRAQFGMAMREVDWPAVHRRWPAVSTLSDCRTRGFFLTFRIAWRRAKVYKMPTHGTGRGWRSFARVKRCHLFGQNLTCEPKRPRSERGLRSNWWGEGAIHPKGGNVPGCLGGPDREGTCPLGCGPIL